MYFERNTEELVEQFVPEKSDLQQVHVCEESSVAGRISHLASNRLLSQKHFIKGKHFGNYIYSCLLQCNMTITVLSVSCCHIALKKSAV